MAVEYETGHWGRRNEFTLRPRRFGCLIRRQRKDGSGFEARRRFEQIATC